MATHVSKSGALSQSMPKIGTALKNLVNTVGKQVGDTPLPQIPGLPTATVNDVTHGVGENSPLANFTQGTVENIPGQAQQDLTKTFGAQAKPEDMANVVPVMGTAGKVADPLEQELPKIAKRNPWQKIIQKLNGLDNYQLSDKYAGNRPGFEKLDKGVMQNVVGGNTAGQVLDRTPAAKDKIWKQVEDTISLHPGLSVEKDIGPHLESQLNDLVGQGLLNDVDARKILETEKAKMMGSSIDADPKISGKDFLDIRTGINRLARKGLDASGSLKDNATPQQILNKSLADGYKSAMINASPETQGLYKIYSSLKRIEEMPNTFRNQILNTKVLGKNVPGVGAARRYGAAVLGGNPIAIGTPLVAGAVGAITSNADKIADSLGYTRKDNANTPNGSINKTENGKGQIYNTNQNGQPNGVSNNNSQDPHMADSIPSSTSSVNGIPQNINQLQPDSNGFVKIPSPLAITGSDGQTIGVSGDAYQKQRAELVNQYKAAELNNPQLANTIQGQIDNLDTKFQQVGKVQDSWDKANAVQQKMESAMQELQQAPPNISQLLNISIGGHSYGLNSARAALDPKYKNLLQDLEYVETNNPYAKDQLVNSASKENLQAALQKANQQMWGDYLVLFNRQVGNQGGTGKPVPTQNQIPAAAPAATAVPQGIKFGGGDIPDMQLPPIK